MNNKKNLKIIVFIIFGLFLVYGFWYFKNAIEISSYLEPDVIATHYNGSNFVGSETCLECHENIYKSHLETAHFNTSSKSKKDHIKGRFTEGLNELDLMSVRLKMIEEEGDYYQLSNIKYKTKEVVKSKIEIVIGSGVKGQSHLQWKGNDLYQLQASYFQPTDSWVNSPNFPENALSRKVDDNCLKCHVTFAEPKQESNVSKSYDRERIMLGIDCERCHGPSEKHVQFHRSNPDALIGKFVDNYKEYSRQQRLDACAVCHSGLQGQQIKGNPFSFIAGDTLSLYSKNYRNANSNTKLDVHGNQMGLLSESSCFVNSSKMDCITCHSPHENQRGNADVFNAKCLSCHDVETVNNVAEGQEHNVSQNCITCHMPLVPSEVMKLKLEDGMNEIPVYIRTHLIGIYK
ncbi:multiheme c-type cytochrome [Maribacter sp. BPC-D8]|uniref:multiheme c-type cytochrome n=1 Tax=Maribacter sp. BPC-D8 TaxID=3053613 RepID=UPI002B470E39|nr:multiheme c-type cytochrome [Maribacter sp. BPC-D8]WRI31320.1 multiheme c-type cytochrome [Maribacter sp. BPC-D8]